MANVVVVGAQWGDEGKGKIVDWLSEQADIVVRFQGGHNAGHTLVINGETYKLALLPSGVLRPSKLAVIGNGVVFDPQAFLDEVARLKGQGVAGVFKPRRSYWTGCQPLPVTRATSAIEVTPALTFSSPSSRSRRIPCWSATAAICSAAARSSVSDRISSDIIITSYSPVRPR